MNKRKQLALQAAFSYAKCQAAAQNVPLPM